MPRGNSPNSTATLTARQREAKAFELRLQGLSLRKIGEQIGVTGAAVSKMLSRRVAKINEQSDKDVSHLRRIELERLDTMWEALHAEAKAGDVKAIKACIEIIKCRSRLLGLEAPQELPSANSTAILGVVMLPQNGREDEG